MNVVDRFLKYVKIESTSNPNNKNCPSTVTQFTFAEQLVKELKELGVDTVTLDENGYIYARINGNVENAPAIGFVAHMDTSPDFSGKNVNPQIIKNYDGSDIVLNDIRTLSPKVFTTLNNYIGEDIITTDGNTLLGSDDKAGIASIMTMAEYFINTPEESHGDICIGFTPDEEIGRGADLFNVELFGADFAYTIDGGREGEIVYENFNACNAVVEVKGRSVHPGMAKGKMINAVEVINKFISMLPANEKPEYTSGYEGFIHVGRMIASCEGATAHLIIRDHDKDKFNQKKKVVVSIVETINNMFLEDVISCELNDNYYNMVEIIDTEENIHIVETAKKAMNNLDIEVLVDPIRGGTDGSRLSFMGVPCPNLFTGGHNAHGPFEYLVVSALKNAVEVQKEIIRLYSKN